MEKYTLHNASGDYMSYQTPSLEKARIECERVKYAAKIYLEVLAPGAFNPSKLVKTGVEVFRNF